MDYHCIFYLLIKVNHLRSSFYVHKSKIKFTNNDLYINLKIRYIISLLTILIENILYYVKIWKSMLVYMIHVNVKNRYQHIIFLFWK